MESMRRIFLRAIGIGLLHALIAPFGLCAADEVHAFYHENVLGTSMELLVRTKTIADAQRAESRVLAEIDRLAGVFSGYDQSSEFARWRSASKVPFRVSQELYELLEAAEFWHVRGAGAFDVRVGSLAALWQRSSALGRLPTPDEKASALALMRVPAWTLDRLHKTALRVSECPISLDGIAKGYIVEKASEAALDDLARPSGVLLNIGGDLRVRGDWSRVIGVASPWADSESSEPFTYIDVENRSVATSGRTQRGFQIQGKWYSHVFDPRSGLPVEQISSATVVAQRGADADALAKVCSVLGPAQSIQVVDSTPGAACLIIGADGRVFKSAGWQQLERPAPVLLAQKSPQELAPKPKAPEAKKESAAPTGANAASWNNDFELLVNFEINQPEAERGRYRRPYVAIWVEDPAGKPVRTLALWVSLSGSGPFQWLPDLKRWYKSDEERKRAEKKDIFFNISRPTRPAGKYKLIWDGKDNDGKQLAAGDYTIFIEAAREHGTYQSIKRAVSLSNKAFREDLKGNVEIRSASIEYRKKAAGK
jgi:thiamine biosynthesis lipoprotein ApbE